MIRLNLLVEGRTEESFCNLVLKPHLAQFEVYASVRCVQTSEDRRRHIIFRGGVIDYGRFKRDIGRWMKEDDNSEACFSSMIDLYGLPADFPGFAPTRNQSDPLLRVQAIEAALAGDIAHRRFIPYIQLHEFEALLFADPEKIGAAYHDRAPVIRQLLDIRAAHQSPEHIDDHPQTAPSKRLIALFPGYAHEKALTGPLVARQIGLAKLREECRHFGSWLERLERLGSQPEGMR